ncbi:hypothetical protein ACFTWF_22845 [Rhodococcus sp. NPDC056960]
MEFHSSVVLVAGGGETATVEWTVTGVHTGDLEESPRPVTASR